MTNGQSVMLSNFKLGSIQITPMNQVDKKVALGIHRFRTKKQAEKYLEKILDAALQDAWRAGAEHKHDSFSGPAYIQGSYGWRLEKVIEEITRLEINDRLKKPRT